MIFETIDVNGEEVIDPKSKHMVPIKRREDDKSIMELSVDTLEELLGSINKLKNMVEEQDGEGEGINGVGVDKRTIPLTDKQTFSVIYLDQKANEVNQFLVKAHNSIGAIEAFSEKVKHDDYQVLDVLDPDGNWYWRSGGNE
jgi:hypothetical protein